MKKIIFAIMFLALASVGLADAGNLMTVYCDGSSATDTFLEGETPCIYGVGFEANADVDIVLENETDVVHTSTETTNAGGIISIRNIWSNLTRGVYEFFADFNNNGQADEGEEKQSLFVIGQPSDEEPNDNEQVEEVPEFGTVASVLVLVIAGLIIYNKRGREQ